VGVDTVKGIAGLTYKALTQGLTDPIGFYNDLKQGIVQTYTNLPSTLSNYASESYQTLLYGSQFDRGRLVGSFATESVLFALPAAKGLSSLARSARGFSLSGALNSAKMSGAFKILGNEGGFITVTSATKPGFKRLFAGMGEKKYLGLRNNGIQERTLREFGKNHRFGPGIYLTSNKSGIFEELKFHGSKPDVIGDFYLNSNPSRLKMLDLDNLATRRAWGIDRRFSSEVNYSKFQKVAANAKLKGYNVIKYKSFRDLKSTNYAVINDYDDLLHYRWK
jgi:hypothetical protein